jgi:hypothetical protein
MRYVIETIVLTLMAFFAGKGMADTFSLLNWL